MTHLLLELNYNYDNNGDKEYSLYDLKRKYPDLQQINDNLIVCFQQNEKHWLDFVFLEWTSEYNDNVYYQPFFYGGGTLDPLRELRHSYLGREGYIFYIKKEHFMLAFNWLSKYFDMD